MNTIKCPNCGCENKNTNIRCESCGTELNHVDQRTTSLDENTLELRTKQVNRIANIIFILFTIPWFVAGLLFIGVSSYSIIKDYNKSKNYLETKGELIDYKDCKKNEGVCTAVYEYTVNGVTYKGSPDKLTDRSNFQQTITIKYNPNNPSEYVMDSDWNILLVSGIFLLIVPLIIICIANKKLKKRINRNP